MDTSLATMTASGLSEWTTAFSELAKKLVESKCLPASIKTEGDLIMIMQAGKDLGMTITEAMQSIAPINGRMSIYGPKVIERARKLGYNFKFEEKFEMIKVEDGKELPKGHCKCIMWKVDKPEDTRDETYTMYDAGKSGLLSKDNWSKYPQLMMRYRAIGLCCKFFAPEVYGGLISREEATDMNIEKDSSLIKIDNYIDAEALDGFTATDEVVEPKLEINYKIGDKVWDSQGVEGIIEDIVGGEAIISFGQKIVTLPFTAVYSQGTTS